MYGKLSGLSVLALAVKGDPLPDQAPPLGVAAEVGAQPQYSGEINMEYYRHGLTCANWVRACRPDHAKWGDCLRDPRDAVNADDPFLTNKGILETRLVAKKLKKPDIVFSSNMLSGIETALELFPDSTVYVAPYIMNIHTTEDKPLMQEEQLSVLKKYLQFEKINRVNYKLVNKAMEGQDMACDKDSETPRCVADWDKFLEWVNTELVDKTKLMQNADLPQGLKDKMANNLPIDVAVVGHGTQLKLQMFFTNDVSLPSNVGYKAKYIPKEDSLEGIENSGGLGDLWNKNMLTDMASIPDLPDVCNHEMNFENVDRCIGRNPEEMNIITGFFMDSDSCPSGDEKVVNEQFVYPDPAEVAVDQVYIPIEPKVYAIAEEGDVESVKKEVARERNQEQPNGASSTYTVTGVLTTLAITLSLVM